MLQSRVEKEERERRPLPSRAEPREAPTRSAASPWSGFPPSRPSFRTGEGSRLPSRSPRSSDSARAAGGGAVFVTAKGGTPPLPAAAGVNPPPKPGENPDLLTPGAARPARGSPEILALRVGKCKATTRSHGAARDSASVTSNCSPYFKNSLKIICCRGTPLPGSQNRRSALMLLCESRVENTCG